MREINLDQPANVMPKNTFLVYGDSRCISGDAFIRYQVRTPEGELQNSKGGTLSRLFHRFHRLKHPGKGSYQRKQTLDAVFWAPSMTEGGRIFQNKILDVLDSGERECVRVRTVGGLELICTPDHPIATSETAFGFVHAAELKVGSTILTHKNVWWTPELEERERVNRPEIMVKHHPVAATKVVRDMARGYENVYKRITRARAVYEAHWNGLTLEAYITRLNDGELDGLKFLSRDVDVHHKDENKLNDVPENLVALSHAEHSREHFVLPNGRPRCGSHIAVDDVVSSVEPAGKHQTYDIKMAAPFHNFVADDFVVHNSGKTTWAATFPRPLFLSDVTEGGWDSIANMDDDQLFEPGVKPIVWGIEQMADMALARSKALALIASGRIQSLVIDSLSFYCDLYLNFLIGMQAKKDMRSAYGDLGNHLRDLRVQTHALQANVVWLCLAKHPGEDNPVGGPMIPGQQADKFMAGVHYIFHSRVHQEKRGQELLPPVFEMRTKKYLNYIAGNRLGGRAADLPDPLVGDYSTLMQYLSYDPNELRTSLPPIMAPGTARPAGAVQAAAVAAKPVTPSTLGAISRNAAAAAARKTTAVVPPKS